MSICRQSTIKRLKYDPDTSPPRTQDPVIWIYPCCGVRKRRVYGAIRAQCNSCARKQAKTKADIGSPIRTELKIIHGQLVEVKIYQSGVPADYTPSYME